MVLTLHQIKSTNILTPPQRTIYFSIWLPSNINCPAMCSSNLWNISYEHFKTLHANLLFANKFFRFTICLVILCFGMTQTKEKQDGRNEFGRSGSSIAVPTLMQVLTLTGNHPRLTSGPLNFSFINPTQGQTFLTKIPTAGTIFEGKIVVLFIKLVVKCCFGTFKDDRAFCYCAS